MGFIKRKRLKQVIYYGWKDAKILSNRKDVKLSRLFLYKDILHCFRKYYIFSNQYKKNNFWILTEKERLQLAEQIGTVNKQRDEWLDYYYDNWKFLSKYRDMKWSKSIRKKDKRNAAYTKRYGFGENAIVQYDVTLICEHYSIGKIDVGKDLLLARGCDIDFSGDLKIGNGVGILEGVKILTHGHDFLGLKNEKKLLPNSRRAFLTPLEIADNVTIGTRSIIMPGVHYIGNNSIVSAGSIVTKRVPDNVIVAGNPAKIVGSIEGLNVYKRSNKKMSII